MSTVTHSEAETSALGRALGSRLTDGSILLLQGDLGAGKTAFVRGVAEGLGIDPAEVNSPTFTLVQEYRGGRLPLHHVDLYRLAPREVDDLGLDEMTLESGVTAIEWPERLPHRWPGVITVSIRHADGDTRTIDIVESE